jgi:adenylate kinase
MRLILLGAPGSGKGTQSQKLIERYRVPQISTGDLLRAARERGTALGRQAQAAMDAGKLVDDAIVLGIIRERLAEPDAARGFILDGFPRNIAQADALADMLKGLRAPIDAVVLMEVDPEVLFRRLSGRRICKECGRVFNIYTSPPGSPPKCDRCQDRPILVQRPDDQEDTIRKRLDVYASQTQPLIDYYKERGLLRRVDAEGEVDEVFARVERALGGQPAVAPAAGPAGRQ